MLEESEDEKSELADNEVGFYKQLIISISEERDIIKSELKGIKEALSEYMNEQKEFSEYHSKEILEYNKLLENSEKLIQDLQLQLRTTMEKLEISSTENIKLHEDIKAAKEACL